MGVCSSCSGDERRRPASPPAQPPPQQQQDAKGEPATQANGCATNEEKKKEGKMSAEAAPSVADQSRRRPVDLEAVKATFQAMDKDGGGTLSFDELCAFVKEQTQLDADSGEKFTCGLRALFDSLDLSGNGQIDIDEFIWGMGHSSSLRLIMEAMGMRAAFRAMDKDGDGTIAVDEFAAFVAERTHLIAEKAELRTLFDFVDLDGNGSVSVDEFVWGMKHSSALRLIGRAHVRRPFEWDKEGYDYSQQTRGAYASAMENPTREMMTEPFRPSRLSVDHRYHGVYSLRRQAWQDTVLSDVCARGADGGSAPWCVFTAGGMGVGKGYALRWLADRGVFPLDRVVHVDPDHFKSCLPEWRGYVARDAKTAGKLCHMESGYLADIAQEVCLTRGLNVLIDGSLRDGDWYQRVFETLRGRFPRLRIAILYVTASEDVVRGRVAKRAAETGRGVPEELWKLSLAQVAKSVGRLAPLADLCCTIDNPGGALRLADLTERGDRSGAKEWEELRSKLKGCADSDRQFRERAERAYADRAGEVRRRNMQSAGSEEAVKARQRGAEAANSFLGVEP